MEETGVKTEFQGVIGMREMLDARYGAADIYIVCLLSVTDEDLPINILDKREVHAA